MIPQYVIFDQLGLTNSLLGLILINIAVTCSVAIFILTGFFRTLPHELFEAAATHDFRRMATLGAARGNLRPRQQYLRAHMGNSISPLKYASVKLQCDQQARNKETTLTLKLSIFKGSRATGFLFRP